MSLLANSNAIESGGYQIANSLRFRSSASAYLNRTPASAGNRKTWTWSGWVKRGALQDAWLLGADDGTLYSQIQISSNYLRFGHVPNTSGTVYQWRTQAVLRDPSAWYHIIFAIDTTQATAANRIRIYLNGVEQTSLVDVTGYGAIPQNTDTFINAALSHMIGRFIRGANNQIDGYLSEVNFIDGQALTPSSFGETNTDGVWVPKKYSGTYGTNGFYLPFSNGSSTTTLCYDQSGNGNNWTPNNISLTSGATYDWMVDTPTNNYAALNPLDKGTSVNSSNGNLDFSVPTAASYGGIRGSFAISQKSYWEVTNTCGALPLFIGILNSSVNVLGTADLYSVSGQATYRSSNGNKNINGTETAYGASNTTNDVIGVAYDPDNGELTFYKNGTSQGTISTGFSGYTYFPAAYDSTSSATSAVFNFGQRPFTYTPPTGFKALCTANLPAAVIQNGGKHFGIILRNGVGGTGGSFTGLNFEPGFLWEKSRNQVWSNYVFDAVRGPSTSLITNDTSSEVTTPTWHTSFNSNGFSVGAADWSSAVTLVDWCWKANGTGVTNTAGSITSQVSANTTAGFSIVTYTGNGTNPGATIGHGLGVAPALIITKSRNGTGEWPSYHKGVGLTNTLYLNATYNSSTYLNRFSAVSSTTFTTGSNGSELNTNGVTYVAYCFAEIAGYSKFGSYTGNGSSDGPFVYCGFRPKYILVKRTDTSVHDWGVLDSSRNPYNVITNSLQPNLSNAEYTGESVDFTSNGFKIRQTSNTWNGSGGAFIFAAFAENPFGGNNVAPATAR